MVERGRFLVVEGNNGVGKSTIVASLAERLDATLHHYPAAFTRFRDDVDLDVQVLPLPRLLYYLAATVHLSDVVTEELATGHVVCDRYLPGPLSLIVARKQLDEEQIERVVRPYEASIRRPDAILLLTSDHATASRRIRARRDGLATSVQRWTLESEDFFTRRQEALRRYAARLAPVAELDTTSLSREEACRQAWTLLAPRIGPAST
jgi:dTMP kinase